MKYSQARKRTCLFIFLPVSYMFPVYLGIRANMERKSLFLSQIRSVADKGKENPSRICQTRLQMKTGERAFCVGKRVLGPAELSTLNPPAVSLLLFFAPHTFDFLRFIRRFDRATHVLSPVIRRVWKLLPFLQRRIDSLVYDTFLSRVLLCASISFASALPSAPISFAPFFFFALLLWSCHDRPKQACRVGAGCGTETEAIGFHHRHLGR